MKLSEVTNRVIELATIVRREDEARQAEHRPGLLFTRLSDLEGPTADREQLTDFLQSQPIAVIYALTTDPCPARGNPGDADREHAKRPLSDLGNLIPI
jgi:hypothetical protein